jgi:hypothetical protein
MAYPTLRVHLFYSVSTVFSVISWYHYSYDLA